MGANKENKIDVKNIIKESAVVLVLVAIIIVFSFLSPQFFKVSNFITILRQISILAIVSVGMTVVLISGGIDLSVGSIISVVSVLTAMSAVYGKLPTGVAIVIGLLLGTLMGLINGVMITMTGMPPMIGTLATQMIFRGLGFIVCDGASVYHLPEEFKIFGQGYVGPIPVPVLIMVIILAIFAFILGRTYIGRYFYAVGSNAEATRLCGLNTQKIQILCIYHPVSTSMKPDFAFACTLFGYEENYTREKAVSLYGSYVGYMKKFQENLSQCIEKGLILEEDRGMCMEYAQRKAREIF